MDAKKKNSEAERDSANGPVKVFLLDEVSASVFARTRPLRGEERTFYSVSFSRSYRDSNNERRYVKTFNVDDLGKVMTVAKQADEHIRKLQAA